MAVVSGGLGLSAVGPVIGMAHAEPTEPTSPSPEPEPPTEPTEPSMPPGPALPPGDSPYIGLPIIPQIPGTF